MTPTSPDSLAGLPNPSALLFDLDGTLVNTVHLRIGAWQRAYRAIGLELRADELGRYMGSDGLWLAREVARTRGVELDGAAAERLDKAAGTAFDELNVQPAPLPAATELLTALEASDRVAFAIATASQAGQVATSVNALRLPARPTITDASHVEKAKPEPDLLLVSAAQIGVEPGRCWYVGDSVWDMMAAVAAGMTAVAVATGATGSAELLAAGATVVLSDLTPILTELRLRGLID